MMCVSTSSGVAAFIRLRTIVVTTPGISEHDDVRAFLLLLDCRVGKHFHKVCFIEYFWVDADATTCL